MLKKRMPTIVIILLLFFIGGLFYFYENNRIPLVVNKAENDLRKEIDDTAKPKKLVAVVTSEEGIKKHSILTDEVIASNIELIPITEDYVVQDAVFDLDLIKNKVTQEQFNPGEQLTFDSLSSEKKWFGDYDRLKDYEVSSIVAGEVQGGNIVDVLVNYGNGTYDVVYAKVKVKKVISPENVNATLETKHRIIFAVDESHYRNLELANKLGEFETRLYLDESQPESEETFDENEAIQKLNLAKSDIIAIDELILMEIKNETD